MKKKDYIIHYTRENKNGQSQMTDRHILMVHKTMTDKNGDPIYKPFLRNDAVISTAKDAGWALATKGLDPKEVKKSVVVEEGEKVVNASEYAAFLAFQKRNKNPEYTTEEEIIGDSPKTPFDGMEEDENTTPDMVTEERVAVPQTPFDGLRVEEVGDTNPQPKKVPIPLTQKQSERLEYLENRKKEGTNPLTEKMETELQGLIDKKG